MTSIYPSGTSSSTNGSTSSANLLRISGMASGIDTDSVVKSMVSGYQTKIDKANQSKQLLQWKQEAYRDIIKGVKELQEYFDPLSDKYLLSGKTLNINTAASDEASIVSATASSSAKAGTYKVNVSQLATQAKVEGSSKDSLVTVSNLSNWSGKTLSFGAGSSNITSITLSSISSETRDSTSMSNLVADINKQISASSTLNGKVSASYVSDGTNYYVKFTKTSTTDITLKASESNNVSDVNSDLAINSGITAGTLLTSSALGFASGNISFALNNGTTSSTVSLAVTSKTTLQNLMDQVKSATNGGVTMNVDDTTGKISFQSKNYGSASDIIITDTSNKIMNKLGIDNTIEGTVGLSGSTTLTHLGFASGNISFNLNNGTTSKNISLTVGSSSTVQNLIDEVNKYNKDTGVTMSIDAAGKILFSGSSSNISITDTSGSTSNNIMTNLGISTNAKTYTKGTDAVVAITGPGQSAAITTTQGSNNFSLNGVTYNLSGINNTTNPSSNITVTANSDTVVNNVKKFITDYNTLIGTINTKLTEKKNSDYPPLTDAQKESMSETQIAAWEAKAKVGILRNDDQLSSLMTQLRGIFSSPVYSNYSSSNTSAGKISLSFGQYGTNSIGIDTTTDVTDGGQLVIKDEKKLKNVIENNFDDFKKMFIGKTDNPDLSSNKSYVGSSNYMEDGLFTRMDNILRDYVAAPGVGSDGTYSLSGSMNILVNKQYDYSSYGGSGKSTIPDRVYSQTVSISKLKTQMSDAETRYYNQFTQLETALSKLNSQQSSLSSMLGTS
ncbi:flagellar filament capping protein FliD [Clostridium beijerinckii]|uniref:Flagellar hook-associated protein 2 n=1 Tax=Clostridium beijerinckii TaxID=1520 RepID=A0A1S8S691_CLOBE|nr:flagellar filament capping protein FliD [Clostridium beijerinckii]NRY60071.1 flagellar hook-associated protein 2 [Clostridium beijerinckii]OOM60927.1 flagellar capping protein [Clostridium beijerinckii]